MRRTTVLTALFAFAVLGVVVVASLLTFARVRSALEDEFARRVEWVALAGAADVQPRQFAILRVAGRGAFATSDSILLSLGAVRRSSQAARVFLVAPDGTLLLDTEADSLVGRPAAAFTHERAAFDQALAGRPSHSKILGRSILGFAPVRDVSDGTGAVAGVLGVEASAEFLAVLPEIGRLLATTVGLAAIAVLLLATFFVRLAAQQQRLERSLARAENLASVGELAATLAHEVRNPLGVIQGAAERLRKHYGGPEPELFDYIQQEVGRLSNTVRRTLDFARPAAGDGGGDVRAAFDATLGLFARELETRKIALVREDPDVTAQAPRVRIGGEELKQALFNLVRNAVEALPESGTLRVGWSVQRREVEAWVSDDGPGMSAELLARVKRPFVTTRAQGTGLGLAIVDRLVRDSGGRFELESAPGRGTTARLHLPRANPDADATTAAST